MYSFTCCCIRLRDPFPRAMQRYYCLRDLQSLRGKILFRDIQHKTLRIMDSNVFSVCAAATLNFEIWI